MLGVVDLAVLVLFTRDSFLRVDMVLCRSRLSRSSFLIVESVLFKSRRAWQSFLKWARVWCNMLSRDALEALDDVLRVCIAIIQERNLEKMCNKEEERRRRKRKGCRLSSRDRMRKRKKEIIPCVDLFPNFPPRIHFPKLAQLLRRRRMRLADGPNRSLMESTGRMLHQQVACGINGQQALLCVLFLAVFEGLSAPGSTEIFLNL